jgi:hypothetical protein
MVVVMVMMMMEEDEDEEDAKLHWPVAQPPAPMNLPQESARLAPGETTLVGTMTLGGTNWDLSGVRKRQGERGKDQRQRKKRKCSRCSDNGGTNADTCKGRARRDWCEYYDENGDCK